MLCVRTLRRETNIIPQMWSIGTQGKLISPIPDSEPLPKDEYFFFGILRGSGSMYKRCQKLGYDFFYADHAYFYNEKFKKMSCFRVTKNNHANTKIINCNSDRYEKFKSQDLKQWHSNNGKKILILPPDYYISLFRNDFSWLSKTVNIIKQNSDREILIRERPLPQNFIDQLPVKPQKIENVSYSNNSLEQDLDDAWCVVVYNSVVSVQALIQGIPVFTDTDICSALPLAEKNFSNIEEPFLPDNREQFLNSLAYSQFTLEEIRSGYAYKTIIDTD